MYSCSLILLILLLMYDYRMPPSNRRETQARLGTARDRIPPNGLPSGKGGYDENGAYVSEQQLRVWEGEENVAHQKAADALVKSLKGAVLWGQGQVSVDFDGKCPVCKKVCS